MSSRGPATEKRPGFFSQLRSLFTFTKAEFGWLPWVLIAVLVVGIGIGVLVGFLLNRWFDIRKPFPCSQLEVLPGGWGVMLDDLVAGIYSNVLLHLILVLTR